MRAFRNKKLHEIQFISRLNTILPTGCYITGFSHWCWFEVVMWKTFCHILRCHRWINYPEGLLKVLLENWSPTERQSSAELHKSTINDFLYTMDSFSSFSSLGWNQKFQDNPKERYMNVIPQENKIHSVISHAK